MTGSTFRRIARSALAALAVLFLARVATTAEADPATILKAGGITPTAANVETYLRGWIVDDALKARITKLVAQLGSEDFDQREQASEDLARIGPTAIEPLRTAAKSTDPEVRQRASDLLTRLDSDQVKRARETLPLAAFQWMAKTKPAGGPTLILDVLPHLTSWAHREAAAGALWACVTPADSERLRRVVREGPPASRAAALPALELAEGDKAVALLHDYLKDPVPAVRVAAARALLDRQPADAATALLSLLDSDDADSRGQAARLLQLLSGIPGEGDRALDWTQATARWREWGASTKADRFRLVGADRLRPDRFGVLLSVTFTDEIAALKEGYGLLRYETNCAGKASMAKGLLRLDGQHAAEGDQRLFVSSEKLLGRERFPKSFEVRAKLGGEAAMAGAWHVAVSVGNVRMLFHPDFLQGSYRVERIDTHAYLHGNENMNFTPAGGVLHEMIVDVTEKSDGTVTLDVRIVDGAQPAREFRRSVQVKAVDIGVISRVALERSGRSGGAGLFGSLTIRQRPGE
jgi:hypothetical protein